MTDYFLLTESLTRGAERGPVTTQAHSRPHSSTTPRQGPSQPAARLPSPPSPAGRYVEVQPTHPSLSPAGLGDIQGPSSPPQPAPPSLELTASPSGSCKAQAKTPPPQKAIPPNHLTLLVGGSLGCSLATQQAPGSSN